MGSPHYCMSDSLAESPLACPGSVHCQDSSTKGQASMNSAAGIGPCIKVFLSSSANPWMFLNRGLELPMLIVDVSKEQLRSAAAQAHCSLDTGCDTAASWVTEEAAFQCSSPHVSSVVLDPAPIQGVAFCHLEYSHSLVDNLQMSACILQLQSSTKVSSKEFVFMAWMMTD